MLVYELYVFNKTKGYELIGALPERRIDPKRITKNSVMNWVKRLSSDDVDSKDIFFKPVRIDLNDQLKVKPVFNFQRAR
jgi:hypothetical protein